MSFVGGILQRLGEGLAREALVELLVGPAGLERRPVSGGELLDRVAAVRGRLRARGVGPGTRVALLGQASASWIAADLATLAEGAVVVALDPRLDRAGLEAQLRDADPALLLCEEPATAPAGSPVLGLLEATTAAAAGVARDEPARSVDESAPATIVYTSGSTGRPRGAVLGRAGLSFMLERTSLRLAELTRLPPGRERALHYLPPCYAGSRVLLLSALLRGAQVWLLRDPSRLGPALSLAEPDYLLNVPLVLERLRAGARAGIQARGRAAAWLLRRAEEAWDRIEDGQARAGDRLLVGLFRALMGRALRRRLGGRLRGLICGSAPLAPRTQRFFRLLGLEVYQGYGLTETTALCTLDLEGQVRPGWVGPALPGVELRRSPEGELETRGPHVFQGYWRDPQATAALLGPDGWLRTGDLGEVDPQGRWRILGRRSAQLALSSGYKVAPEPLEEALRLRLGPLAGEGLDVLLFGQGRPGLVALVTGTGLERSSVARAVQAENALRPPHQRVRGFHLAPPLTVEDGLLTANLKPRRAAIEARWARELDAAAEALAAAATGGAA